MDRRAGWALAPLLACGVENPLFVLAPGEGGETTVVAASMASAASEASAASTAAGSGTEGSGEGGSMTGGASAISGTATGESATTCPEEQDICEPPPDPCGRGEGCTGAADWLVRSGDGAVQRSSDAALLVDGGVAMVGSFAGQLGEDGMVIIGPVDPAQGDGFLMRLDADGELLWLRQFGGGGLQWATTVAATPGGKIGVGGSFTGQIVLTEKKIDQPGSNPGFVGMFAADGALLWLSSFGAGTVVVNDLAATADGGLVVVGDFIGGLLLGADVHASADLDPFIARFDAAGQVLWSAAPHGDGPDGARGVAVGPDGSTTVTGYFQTALDLGGGALMSKGQTDVYVVRYGPGGEHLRSVGFGGPGQDFGLGAAISPTGRLALAGSHGEGLDLGDGPLPVMDGFNAFFAVFEPDGELVWVHGGVHVASLQMGVGIDALGRVVVAASPGSTEIDLGDGPMPATMGVNLAKYAADGALAWVHSLEKFVTLAGHGLDVDEEGRIAVSGSFAGTLMYPGVDTLNSAGELDVFAGRFQP